MTELVVDMTPTVVNRTAIYHIARDTFAAIPAEQRAIQYRGRAEAALVPDGPEAKALAERFFRDVAAFAEAHVHHDELSPAPPHPDARPRLYFDPLYTLYRPLGAEDAVFVLDMTTLTNPEWHEPHVVRVYERAFRKLAASPAKIVSISRHTTDALRASFSIPASSIVTVPLYVRAVAPLTSEAPDAPLVPGKFLLFVGSLETRKNLVGLMEAFELTGLQERGYSLAIAGGRGRGAEEITAAAVGVEGVHLLGFVTDGELRWLYENALAFAYPSHLEGFGVPLIEAMSFGLPCLAPTTGAPPEICGELGALVDPTDLGDIAEGLRTVVAGAEAAGDAFREALRARAAEYTFPAYMAELRKALPAALRDS